jgi:hypothetical protein
MRFTIRDLLWLTAVVAMPVASGINFEWYGQEVDRLTNRVRHLETADRERDVANRKREQEWKWERIKRDDEFVRYILQLERSLPRQER